MGITPKNVAYNSYPQLKILFGTHPQVISTM